MMTFAGYWVAAACCVALLWGLAHRQLRQDGGGASRDFEDF